MKQSKKQRCCNTMQSYSEYLYILCYARKEKRIVLFFFVYFEAAVLCNLKKLYKYKRKQKTTFASRIALSTYVITRLHIDTLFARDLEFWTFVYNNNN